MIIRLYTGEDGQAHFEDLNVPVGEWVLFPLYLEIHQVSIFVAVLDDLFAAPG